MSFDTGFCWWCGQNNGTLAVAQFIKGPKVLDTPCRRMFAPEGWQISEEEAQKYCEDSWEEVK